LKLRGSGDLLGTRQSGDMEFQMADIFRDADILQKASEAASELLADDPYEIVQSFSILSNQAVIFIRFCILKPDFFVIFHNPMSWFSRSRYDFITFFSSSCSGFSK